VRQNPQIGLVDTFYSVVQGAELYGELWWLPLIYEVMWESILAVEDFQRVVGRKIGITDKSISELYTSIQF
jgi:hypothetical protein